MPVITTRFFSRKACDKTEKIQGVRITHHTIEKRSNKKPKFIQAFAADKNM